MDPFGMQLEVYIHFKEYRWNLFFFCYWINKLQENFGRVCQEEVSNISFRIYLILWVHDKNKQCVCFQYVYRKLWSQQRVWSICHSFFPSFSSLMEEFGQSMRYWIKISFSGYVSPSFDQFISFTSNFSVVLSLTIKYFDHCSSCS